MANEISLTASLACRLNGTIGAVGVSGFQTMSGDNLIHAVQNVGIVAETLSFGDLSGAPGLLYVRNMDPTNFVDMALDSGMTKRFARFYPGDWALFKPGSATLYVKADTAQCQMEVLAIENVVGATMTAHVPQVPDTGTKLDLAVAVQKNSVASSAQVSRSVSTMAYLEHATFQVVNSPIAKLFKGVCEDKGVDYLFARSRSGSISCSFSLDALGTDIFASLPSSNFITILPMYGANPYLYGDEAGTADIDAIGVVES
jgi:hypothetical protein